MSNRNVFSSKTFVVLLGNSTGIFCIKRRQRNSFEMLFNLMQVKIDFAGLRSRSRPEMSFLSGGRTFYSASAQAPDKRTVAVKSFTKKLKIFVTIQIWTLLI